MLDWSESASTRPVPPSLAAAPLPQADQTGLGDIDRRGGRVSVDDKRMINCRADVNQLLPLMDVILYPRYKLREVPMK